MRLTGKDRFALPRRAHLGDVEDEYARSRVEHVAENRHEQCIREYIQRCIRRMAHRLYALKIRPRPPPVLLPQSRCRLRCTSGTSLRLQCCIQCWGCESKRSAQNNTRKRAPPRPLPHETLPRSIFAQSIHAIARSGISVPSHHTTHHPCTSERASQFITTRVEPARGTPTHSLKPRPPSSRATRRPTRRPAVSVGTLRTHLAPLW